MRTDQRCLAMKAADSGIGSSPEIHLEQADLPIECIILQAHDFKSILWEGLIDDPTYTQWLLSTDMTSVYAYHKLHLQVLQAHTRGAWQLKAPAHTLGIETLRKVYPDARIVWTHRDPYRTMGSVCSFIASSRRAFGAVDEAAIGPRSVEIFKQHVVRPMALDRREPGVIYHLHYAALIRDPVGEIRKLYSWLGDAFTPMWSRP